MRFRDPAPAASGLTTALSVTRTRFRDRGQPSDHVTAQSATAQAGCLLVLNSHGKVIETIAGGPINGPWDMTAVEHGFLTTLYVTNVLNGTVKATTDSSMTGPRSTVARSYAFELLTLPGIRPIVLNEDVIATGFAEETDPAALVIGPTGVALGRDGTLYVADTVHSRIQPSPTRRSGISRLRAAGSPSRPVAPLNGPLGMTLAPNGDILTANGGDGNIVETRPFGGAQTDIAADSTNGAGALFGLTVTPDRWDLLRRRRDEHAEPARSVRPIRRGGRA